MVEMRPKEWVKKGIAMFGYSFEGHGRSEGIRCHIDAFDFFVDDLAQFVLETRAQYGKQCPPCFVFGESMGGAVALLATYTGGPLHDAVNGCIFIAPMCKLSKDVILSDLMVCVAHATRFISTPC